MALPEVVTHDEWLAARKRAAGPGEGADPERDALNAERRRLPMVEDRQGLRLRGPGRRRPSLLDLFDGRRQLIVGHFMFDPSWDDGCPSCTAGADEVAPGYLEHLHARDTTFVYVSRAPLAKIEHYKARKGWTFPWYSSFGSDFNYDFHVTLDESVDARSSTTSAPRPSSSGGQRVRRRRSAGRAAGHELLPARRRHASSTRTRSTRAAPRRSAARTTCSTRPRSVARRTGRSRRVVRTTSATRRRTSAPDPPALPLLLELRHPLEDAAALDRALADDRGDDAPASPSGLFAPCRAPS